MIAFLYGISKYIVMIVTNRYYELIKKINRDLL